MVFSKHRVDEPPRSDARFREAYRQFIEDIYRKNALSQKELDSDPVDIGTLTMPVVLILGSFDHLIPPEAAKPFTEGIPSEDIDI